MILLDGVLLTSDALKDAARDLTLRLSVDATADAVRGAAMAVAGLREVVADPDSAGRFLVRAERRPSLATELVSALVAARIPVRELTELRPDLERVFLDLTRRPEAAA